MTVHSKTFPDVSRCFAQTENKKKKRTSNVPAISCYFILFLAEGPGGKNWVDFR